MHIDNDREENKIESQTKMITSLVRMKGTKDSRVQRKDGCMESSNDAMMQGYKGGNIQEREDAMRKGCKERRMLGRI